MAQQKAVRDASTALAQTKEQALARFQEMGFMVPEIEQDGGMGIVLDILAAGTLQDLDAAWQEKDGDRFLDLPMVIHDVRRGDSDYADGLGLFLAVRATIIATGEQVTFSTGSVSVVAQLVRAHALELFPFVAILRKAKKPSRNGYWPLHLEIEEDQSKAAG